MRNYAITMVVFVVALSIYSYAVMTDCQVLLESAPRLLWLCR